MASCSGNGSRGHHAFTLNVSETYVSDGVNNYSDVSWSLVMSPITSGYDWNYSSTVPVTWSVSVNGANASGNIMQYDGSSTVTVGSGSLRVYHDADGSKAIGFSFGVSSINQSYLPGSASGNGSMWLTKINRQATITNAYDFTDEENPHFTFSNPGGYPMNVWLEPNPTGEHLCVRNNIPNTGSYTWSLSEEEWDFLRDKCSGKSCTVRIGLYTNINGTLLASYQDKTMTIVRGKSQANYKVNGVWKKALAFIKVNGEWKKSKVYKKINNEWKEGH